MAGGDPPDPGEDEAMQLRHADAAVTLGDRTDRADEREESGAIGHRRRGGDGMRAAAGDADDREPVEPERIGKRRHVFRRVRQRLFPAKIGKPIARPLGRDDAQAPRARAP